jgi:hypothetical protein
MDRVKNGRKSTFSEESAMTQVDTETRKGDAPKPNANALASEEGRRSRPTIAETSV